MPGFTTIFFGLGPGLTPYGTGLRAGAQVLFGTTPGTVAYGEKLPGPYPIDTTGATMGQVPVFNGTKLVMGTGTGGVANPLTSNLSAAGVYTVTNLAKGDRDSNSAARVNDLEAIGWKPRVRLCTVAPLPAFNYASNVITAAGNGALSIDGVAVALGDRVLVVSEAGALRARHGFYEVTATGDGSNPFVMTRSPDCRTSNDLVDGAVAYVVEGTVLAGVTIGLRTSGTIILDTTQTVWGPLVTSGKYVERVAGYTSLELGAASSGTIDFYPNATLAARFDATGALAGNGALALKATSTNAITLATNSTTRLTVFGSGCLSVGSAPDVGAADVLAFPLTGQGTFRDGSNTRQFFYFAANELHLGYFTSVTPHTHVEAGTAVHLSVASNERMRVDGNDNAALGASIVATGGRSAGMSLPYGSRVESRNQADGAWVNLIRLDTALTTNHLVIGTDPEPDKLLAKVTTSMLIGTSGGNANEIAITQDATELRGGLFGHFTSTSTSPYAVTANDYLIEIDNSSAAKIVNLPTLGGQTTARLIVIKAKADASGANTVTINRGGSDTIEGATSLVITSANNGCVTLAGNTGVWRILTNLK